MGKQDRPNKNGNKSRQDRNGKPQTTKQKEEFPPRRQRAINTIRTKHTEQNGKPPPPPHTELGEQINAIMYFGPTMAKHKGQQNLPKRKENQNPPPKGRTRTRQPKDSQKGEQTLPDEKEATETTQTKRGTKPAKTK